MSLSREGLLLLLVISSKEGVVRLLGVVVVIVVNWSLLGSRIGRFGNAVNQSTASETAAKAAYNPEDDPSHHLTSTDALVGRVV